MFTKLAISFAVFLALVLPIDLSAEMRDYNPTKVCRSYEHHPTFRTDRCVTIYLKEIKRVLDFWYDENHTIPNASLLKIKFYSESDSAIVRNLMGSNRVLGIARELDNSFYEIIMLTPTKDFKIPVDIVLIHELAHIMDFHNNIMEIGSETAEILARDIAVSVYFSLFK